MLPQIPIPLSPIGWWRVLATKLHYYLKLRSINKPTRRSKALSFAFVAAHSFITACFFAALMNHNIHEECEGCWLRAVWSWRCGGRVCPPLSTTVVLAFNHHHTNTHSIEVAHVRLCSLYTTGGGAPSDSPNHSTKHTSHSVFIMAYPIICLSDDIIRTFEHNRSKSIFPCFRQFFL